MPGVKKGTTTTKPTTAKSAVKETPAKAETKAAAINVEKAPVVAESTKTTIARTEAAAKTTVAKTESVKTAVQVVSATVIESPSVDKLIAERAFFLFLERGGNHGQDVNDWLRAESEVKALVGAK